MAKYIYEFVGGDRDDVKQCATTFMNAHGGELVSLDQAQGFKCDNDKSEFVLCEGRPNIFVARVEVSHGS